MAHFTIKELCKSDTATKLKISNDPTPTDKKHLQELIDNLLEPLRQAWGAPIKVTSGYRGFRLNQAVKGSKSSAHCYGYAADLVPTDGHIDEFKAFVKLWLIDTNVDFDQYIDEKSGNSTWVHLGLRNGEGKLRKQFLKYRNGTYTLIK